MRRHAIRITLLVLAPTRWKLRAAVKVVNRVLASLDLKKHPAKTFIGRIEKGFDWLGYHLRPDGLRLAAQTLRNFAARMARLYEQESRCADGGVRLGSYVQRWMRWATGGLSVDGNRAVGLVMATCALGSLSLLRTLCVTSNACETGDRLTHCGACQSSMAYVTFAVSGGFAPM